jgi:CheY-like chemotaxis protein
MHNNIKEVYKTLTILCVEDDPYIAEIYDDMFSLMFKKVYIAHDGIEGVQYFEKEKIDIILTDYKMPLCDGLEMSERIRQIDATIPIIMVTALESLEMLKKVIDVNITSFLKKPFTTETMYSSFNLAVKSIIADRLLVQEQMEKILYSDYQENLTYAKEKQIIKNDLEDCHKFLHYHCDIFYKSKDTLSGDSYLIKQISEDAIFVFIVDGMGKGISASVTAMMCSAFLNYKVEQLKKQGTFSLESLIASLYEFIHSNLLEEEVISANFIYLNGIDEEMHYATFSMPPILYMLKGDDTVRKIRSNNPPMANYTTNFTVESCSMKDVSKMLIYSDGLNENTLKNSANLYNVHLKDDFKIATDKDSFEKLREHKVEGQEDDITYLFLRTEVL